jgi:hypothetical protein
MTQPAMKIVQKRQEMRIIWGSKVRGLMFGDGYVKNRL